MRYISTAAQLADLLDRSRPSGRGFVACCPAHDDREPSLSIWDDGGGAVAMNCHSGCDYRSIAKALSTKQIIVQPRPNGRHYEPTGLLPRAASDTNAVRKSAVRAWKKARWATRAGHPYIERKEISGRGLKVSAEGELLVPIRDLEGKLQSLQRIVKVGGGLVRKTPANPNGRAAAKFKKLTLRGTDLNRDIGFVCGDYDGHIFVCEGMADAWSIKAATGQLSVATLGASRLVRMAKALRTKYPDAELVIAADNDEPGIKAANEAALAVGGRIAVPTLPKRKGKVDFNDVFRDLGPRAVRKQLAGATQPAADKDVLVAELARMSHIEYGAKRKEVAERLGIDARFLDKEVEQRRRELRAEAASPQGSAIAFDDVEPWPEPVDGDELLSNLSARIRKHVVLDGPAADAVALWVVHTHAIAHAQVTPILAITSPEKRCGKSSLLALLLRLVRNPLPAANISPAAVFRTTSRHEVSLLIDEGDSFLRANDELRGVLNSGHTRDTAFVVRTVGDDHEPRRFSTWSAKALALIGSLPDTLEDRSILLRLRRKLVAERVKRVSRSSNRLLLLKRKIVRWASDAADDIATATSRRIPGLHDRAADNWSPLLAIAQAAGGRWPQRAANAAAALSGSDAQADSTREILLRDLKQLFGKPPKEYLLSHEIVALLAKKDDRPWPEFRAGKALTPPQLAALLRPFEIAPAQIRTDNRVQRGYRYRQFKDVFARYLADGDKGP